ncbi:hypothetical protein A0256_13445 [Mucilaginibacter sp. PAMC 26640]|nr:hypothetical protein A0256_13445 [Mucilaginibacter sp. PAMC 26640]
MNVGLSDAAVNFNLPGNVANILGLVYLLDKEHILREDNMEILLLLSTAIKDLDAEIQMINQITLD